MRAKMTVGYSRVSSQKQAKKGNSLEYQEMMLRARGAVMVYSDVARGTSIERPQLTKLLESLEEGDTLMVTSMDRLVRSVSLGNELLGSLSKRGINVNILDANITSDTATGKYIRNMLLASAEYEVDSISERTQAGKGIAKLKSGYGEGRPHGKN